MTQQTLSRIQKETQRAHTYVENALAPEDSPFRTHTAHTLGLAIVCLARAVNLLANTMTTEDPEVRRG